MVWNYYFCSSILDPYGSGMQVLFKLMSLWSNWLFRLFVLFFEFGPRTISWKSWLLSKSKASQNLIHIKQSENLKQSGLVHPLQRFLTLPSPDSNWTFAHMSTMHAISFQSPFSFQPVPYSSSIHTESEKNHLDFRCSGSSFSFAF